MQIDEESIDLADLIWKIEEETDCEFIFNYKDVKDFTKLNVKAEGDIEEVLQDLLKDKGLDYILKGSVYIIGKETNIPKTKSNSSEQEKKKTIKGKVTDENGVSLPGVTVKLKGTYIGTATNIDGFFQLSSSQETGVLVFSFVGKATKNVKFKYGDKIVVQLEDNASELNEVVVLAYDEREEKEIISSVSTITAKDMKDVPVDNFLELLQGRMTGVNVTHSSGVPGGAGTKINIRGYNSLMMDGSGGESDGSPLYVVDGVPMASFVSPVTGTNVISDLNPENIASVTVLKDASSAALYGSRAANGVIMIKTKEGKAGYNVFTVNLSQSYTYNPEYPEMIGGAEERRMTLMRNINTHMAGYDIMSGDYAFPTSYLNTLTGMIFGAEYDYNWRMGQEYNEGGGIVHDSINPYYNNSTNWFKQMYRTGKISNVNVQASGGSENMKYLVGLGAYNNVGIMQNSSYKRIDGLVNLTAKPSKNLDINSRTIIAYADRSLNAGKNGFGLNKANQYYITADPMLASTLERADGAGAEDQVEYLRGEISKADSYRINTILGLRYSFLKHFNWNNSFSWDLQQDHSNQFQPSYLHFQNKSRTAGNVTRNQELQFESVLKFDKTFSDNHNVGVMLGYSVTRNTFNLIYGEGYGGPSDDIHYRGKYGWMDYDQDDNKVQLDYYSDFWEKMMVGLFARFNYNYKQKYLLSATLRRDGSSTFGIDTRWGYFPSIGAGWNFSDESFMDWAHWLDNAKIRASWGRTGRPLRQPYLAHGAVVPSDETFNGKPTVSPSTINYNLEWEKSDQYNIGLDFSIFNRRIITKLDYYYKYTFDMLRDAILPGDNSGVQSMWKNSMALSNEGLEFSIDAVILRNSDLKWRSRFNISRNWNKLEKTYNGRDFNNNVLGKPINRIGVYEDDGFYAKGEELPFTYDLKGKRKNSSHVYGRNVPESVSFRKIKDINEDGVINGDDVVYKETALPAAYGGFSNEFKYKNFSLSFLMNFTLGQHMIDGISYNSMGQYPYIFNPANYTTYDQVGPSADLPIWGAYAAGSLSYETFLASRIEKVSYMKLSTLTFGYELPREICNKVNMKSLRLFLTGKNLFRIDNYSGIGDPEQVNIVKGVVDKVYPLSRNITIGLTAKF
jgi:TonB-linked SusC/RagA family outer membrane protein